MPSSDSTINLGRRARPAPGRRPPIRGIVLIAALAVSFLTAPVAASGSTSAGRA
jgi:hypothetical protein